MTARHSSWAVVTSGADGDIRADSYVRVILQAVVPEIGGPLCLDLELHLSRRDVIVNRYQSTIAH